MTSAEMIDWIYNDGQKADADYTGIMVRPYTKKQDVAAQLQQLVGSAKDGKLPTFFRKYGFQNILDEAELEITDNNKDWQQELVADINKAKDQDDLEAVRIRLESEGGIYENTTVTRIEKALDSKVLPKPVVTPEERLTPSQRANIIDILGIPEEAIDDIGLRQIQFQLEEQLREEVETARTLSELDDVEGRLDVLPTKSAIRRLRSEIRSKQKELEDQEQRTLEEF